MMEHGAASREQNGARERTAPCSALLLAIVSTFAVAPVPAGGQQPSGGQPSAGQVQQALQQQPGLADQVRNRISQSGLTPEQIRARLQASGYPATLLDS